MGAFSAVYFTEELIPTTASNKFMKFIHNGNASPRMLGDPVADEIAEFLSFMQHVQYIKMGGQVFISDYQGRLSHYTHHRY
jgi:hypothetical protein